MKTSVLATSMLCVLLTTACDRRNDPDNAPTSDASTTDAMAPNPSEPTEAVQDNVGAGAPAGAGDALALGMLTVINDHEIQAAQQAQTKNVSAPVLDYARLMEESHTENLVATKALGPIADTSDTQAMSATGKSQLAVLNSKTGRDYEAGYIETMVKAHTDALALIDTRLLALSSDGPVKDHMTDTRAHVAMHLKAAQDLQARR